MADARSIADLRAYLWEWAYNCAEPSAAIRDGIASGFAHALEALEDHGCTGDLNEVARRWRQAKHRDQEEDDR
jgi:hypothetical protein